MKRITIQPGAVLNTANRAHDYTLHGVPVSSSVTGRVDRDILQSTFDSVRMSNAVFALCEKIRRAPDVEYTADQREQYRKHGQYQSAEEIAMAWERNRDRGTDMHKTIELYLNDELVPDDPRLQTPEMAIFFAFYRNFSVTHTPVATEAAIVMPEIDTGGCVDCVWQEKNGDPSELVIVDWKKMAPKVLDQRPSVPRCKFFDLPACDAAKKIVQMNMYASMIEAVSAYRVKRMFLVYIDVENGLDVVEVERRAEETAAYLSALKAATSDALIPSAEQAKPLRGLIK